MARQFTPRHSRLISRSPIFYGWVVWGIATLGWIATSPGQAFSIALFVDDFIRDFQLDRTMLSTLFALGTLMGAGSLAYIGRSIDRYGNRRMAVLTCLLFGGVLLAWMFVDSALGVLIGFVAIRTLGQGALSLVNTTAIAAWFWRRRGWVMSLSLTVFSLWQAAYVPFVQRLLEQMDWHRVWGMMGLAILLIVLPLTALLLRNQPEEYGLVPDGAVKRRAAPDRPPLVEDNWTLAESIHTPIFWIIMFGRVVSPAWGSGLILHNISIITSLGYTARTAAETYSQLTLISAGFALVFGWLIDRMRPGWVLGLQLSGLIVALIALTLPPAPYLLPLYAVSFAVVMGGGAVIDTSVWANLFGRAHQGAIRGFVSMIVIAATALGPILFGLSYDLLGSYDPVLWLGVALTVPGIVLAALINKPRHRWQVQPATGD